MTIENKIHHIEIIKTEDKVVNKKKTNKPEKPPKIFSLKKYDVFSYVLKKYDDTGEPTYSNELAEYFKLTVKRIDEYLEELEDKGLLWRPKENCPQPNFPTSEGRDGFYNKIITLFPRCCRSQIQRIITISLGKRW